MWTFTVTGVVEESTGRLLVGPVYLDLPVTAVARQTVPGYLPYEEVFEAKNADDAIAQALATATNGQAATSEQEGPEA